MKKKRHKGREHHPTGELQNLFILLTHMITTCKKQALAIIKPIPCDMLAGGKKVLYQRG